MPTTLTPVTDGPEPTLRDVLLAISGLDGRMDRLDSRLDRLEGRMDRMDERFNQLDSRVERLEIGINVLATRATGVDAAIGKMDKRITDLMAFEGANIKWLTERDFEVREYLAKRHDEVDRHLADTDMHVPRQRGSEVPALGRLSFNPQT